MRIPRPVATLALLVGLALPAAAPAAENIRYSGGQGKPLTIVVREAPISEVYEMLSRHERVNVLLGQAVMGEVSVNLFDVSLDRAIRSIADAAGYVAEKRHDTYVIIDREDAGEDHAGANTVIRAFKIEYSDPDLVSGIVEDHLSRYGAVNVLEPRRLLVVEDLPQFVRRVEKLLAEIDRDPAQILIEAKILEITLDDSQSFGVDWSRVFDVDKGMATIGARDLALPGSAGLFFDLLTRDVELTLTALAEKGRVRTLSTPRLLALEHQEAEVVIGDRLGFRVTTTINEVTTESVEFLESGVILRFAASVDRAGRVVLEIHPEVSTGVISDGLPTQTTTEVTTKLVTASGKPVFIAGLLKDRQTKSRQGIPFLMDIPLLGRLFARTESIDVNTETVVILTARIVGEDTAEMADVILERQREFEEEVEDNREDLEENF